MSKKTLNFKFNNPNSVEDTAEMLLKFFAEVNKPRIEEAIKNMKIDADKKESHSV